MSDRGNHHRESAADEVTPEGVSPGSTLPRDGHPWAWLAAILVLAGALRLIGLGWGLPDIDAQPDELTMIRIGLQCGTGDFNPHMFDYPTLLGYVLFGCYVALAAFWKLTGVIASPSDIVTRFAEDPSAFFLTARLVAALSGTATVGLVYLLGRRVYGTTVGLAAAFILAVAPLPVRLSHFGHVDPPMAFLTTLSLLPTWNIYTRGRRSDYLWAGTLVGLAASTKYYGAAAAVAIFAAHCLRPRRPVERWQHTDLILAGLASIAAFLAASPFILVSPHEFWYDFHANVFTLQGSHNPAHTMQAWRFHFLYTLPLGLTWPIFLAGLAGLVGVFLTDWRRSLVLYCFPLVFYALIGGSWNVIARYTGPTLPFLALAAGWLLAHAAAAGHALGWGPSSYRRAAAALTAIVCVPSLVEDRDLLRLYWSVDTRHVVTTWAKESLPDGATIGWLGTLYGRPPLPETPESLERRRIAAMASTKFTPERLARTNSGRLVKKRIELARRGPSPRFLVVDLSQEPSGWNEEWPEYLLTERYRMHWVENETASLNRWLEAGGYHEVRRWTVTAQGEPLPFTDPVDGVYLPFGHLSRARCSGPELALYKR